MESCAKCRKMSVSSDNRRKDWTSFTLGPTGVLAIALLINLVPEVCSVGLPTESMLISKRMASPSATDLSAEDGYTDYQSGIRYDEYPVVVPKRAALIIDRILKEIEAARENNQLVNDWSPVSRRGNNKDKLYFRCYFNAVSCYRKK